MPTKHLITIVLNQPREPTEYEKLVPPPIRASLTTPPYFIRVPYPARSYNGQLSFMPTPWRPPRGPHPY